MATNTYEKGQPTRLSTNFKSTEFDCHGRGCCSTTVVDPQLVKYLQQIREHFDTPITITSAYRCPVHNRNIGGATRSQHCQGAAADIVVKGIAPKEVAKYAESIGVKGIGLYETSSDGFFTHIDTRQNKSFWYGQSEQYRSTFGGTAPTNPVVNNSSTTIQLNDKGPTVKEIQTMLVSIGYNLSTSKNQSGIDGIFGMKTYNAIRDFQSKNNLLVNGIVDADTFELLEKYSNQNKLKVKITANILNVRNGASLNNPIIGIVKKDTTHTIFEIKNGWGKIANPSGWISMDYAIAI